MKKVLVAVLAWLAWTLPALAGSVSLLGAGAGPGGGGGNDPATTAWVAAVVSAGGTVSGTQTTRVNTLIVAAKAHGWFSTCDRVFLTAGESVSQQATIDIINLGTATVTNAPTLNAAGYTGNAFNTSFNTGITPSTFTGNYVLNSALFAYYRVDNSAAGNNNSNGTNHTAPQTYIYDFAFATLWAYGINSASFNSGTNTANGASNTGGAGSTTGFWGISRTSSTATAMYRNASSTAILTNGSDTSTSLPASQIQLLAGDGNNNANTIAAGAICAGMTGAQWATFSADVNAYMTAWGINVF